MFIKKIPKRDKKTGRVYVYYRLCESYRIGSRPRHRTILNLGGLKEIKREEEMKLLAERIEEIIRGEGRLIEEENEVVERLARQFSKKIIEERLLDTGKREVEVEEEAADYKEVDINSLRNEKAREIGAEWMCKQIIEGLGIEGYLKSKGWKEKWIKRGILYIIAKAVNPGSERKMAEWIRLNSGVSDLVNIKAEKVRRGHLYRVSEMLYKEKEGIERYLNKRIGEMFGLEEKIIIYDFTNVYYEGKKEGSKKARYGKSKERRDDAKIMAIGLLVNIYGFIKHSRICEGDISESKGFKREIEEISKYSEGGKKVVVIDAGLATEGNLKVLKEGGYEYVCVGRGKLETEGKGEGEGKNIKDKRGNDIYIKWIKEEGGESYLYVRSKKKEKKEEAMDQLLSKRYEEGLKGILEGIKRKGGVKKVEKVYERIGRLKGKYARVSKLYKVEVEEEGGIAKDLKWERVKEKKHGEYFIRTTFKERDEETIWKIYNTIREVEETFRVIKSDLKVRPIHHIKDNFSEAHIFGS